MIINDPVYGFTRIPRGLLCAVIDHPYFQRLGRIRQLGMASMVYPGAVHTRKQHSLGAFHLMQEALRVLMEKGEFLFDAEVEATEVAILLHDVGHGPYSHVLEQVLTPGVTHEALSLRMMEQMNEDLHGELGLAIKVMRGEHPKAFLHELICSQLDMDRLDYLCRDSFFTGVIEGNIGAARIIKMLEVVDDHLAVHAKGIYTVEHYLMARRLMYWQVYLHKTAVAAEEMLRSALHRAMELACAGEPLYASPSLLYFLRRGGERPDLLQDADALHYFADLDDSDLVSAVKVWRHHDDRVLSLLSAGFVERRLHKAEVFEGEVPDDYVGRIRDSVAAKYGLKPDEVDYFVRTKVVHKEMYATHSDGIRLVNAAGQTTDVAAVSNIVRGDREGWCDRKTYLFYPSIA